MSQLSTLDLLGAKLHTKLQPVDFTTITEMAPNVVTKGGLKLGMISAMKLYPSSGSVVSGGRWEWSGLAEVTEWAEDDDVAATSRIQETINCRLTASEVVVTQAIVRSKESGREWVATRFHHSCTDGIGADMWLTHQLKVATGEIEPHNNLEEFETLNLKSSKTTSSKGPTAHSGRSQRLWCQGKQSGERGWVDTHIEKSAINEAVSIIGDVTLNDFLGERLLATAASWNKFHGWPTSKLSLWIPVDIRADIPRKFGNGASRIRIYRDSILSENQHSAVRSFRANMREAKSSGEWVVPTFKLPHTLSIALTKVYINRPWVDMGTIPFSHIPSESHIESKAVKQTNWIIVLHRWHPAGFIVSTDDEYVRITLTYDKGALKYNEATELLSLYRKLIEEAI